MQALWRASGTEKDTLYHCKEWENQRLQLSDEVRAMEQIAKGGGGCWQWERGIAPFPGANQTERVVNHEKGRFLWKCKGPSRGLKCWALCLALCKLCGLSEMYTDYRGVVQALNKGEVECISAGG